MRRALIALAALRTIIDTVDAVDELAHRFGVDPLGAHGQVGEWDLDADLSLSRFGIGLVVERDPARSSTWPEVTVVALHLGPLALTTTRERPYRGPAGDEPPVALDCGLAGPLGDVGDPLPGRLEAAAGDPRVPELEALEDERARA